MPCRSIADVLRGLGEVPPSDMALVDAAPEPPVSFGTPWLDVTKIAVVYSRDFRERLERGCDDRTFEQRSADATEARARTRRPAGEVAVQLLVQGRRQGFDKRSTAAETRAHRRNEGIFSPLPARAPSASEG